MMRPSITAKGTYDKRQLYVFIEQARRDKLSVRAIAEVLRVPVDRIHYVMGPGHHIIFRGIA